MTNAVPQINKSSSGLCPHGMSPSACPICSGMGGGSSLRVGERPQKSGEMSYHQCAMIGAMMKAREYHDKVHQQNLLHHAEMTKAFEQNLMKISQNLSEFSKNIQNNFILKPIGFTINHIVVPTINFVRNIPKVLNNISEKISQLKEKIIDIQDKLNAIFGEAKAFIEKKVSELVSNFKSKLITLLKVFKRNNTKDDETKIDEDKKIFNLKTFIQKIWKKKKDDSKDNARS